MAVDFGNGPQIKSRAIQGQKVDVMTGGDNGWGALADGIASAGANAAAGISARASKADKALDSMDKPKKTNLDKRIDKANEQGKTAKATRLTGKKERRTIKDKNRASRINAKNKDKKAALTKSEFFKGQKFNEKQKEKGGTTSASHLFKPASSLKPKGISEIKPEFSTTLAPSPFGMKTFDKFSTIAKKL